MTTAGHALILADGDAPSPAALDRAWPGWDEGIDLVIAADGGARHAASLGRTIDLWVGDGDSLGADGVEALRAAGVPVELAPVDRKARRAATVIADKFAHSLETASSTAPGMTPMDHADIIKRMTTTTWATQLICFHK